MRTSIAFFILALFVCLPVLAFAETVVRTGENVSIASDQLIENDFYTLANTVSMSGGVKGDMYSVGGSVTVNGTIDEDLFVLGGTSQVHASVTDDVRIVSGEAVIADYVGGDVFVIAGSLKVLSTAHIEGNVYFYGHDASIEGAVRGSIVGAADKLRIDAPIGESIDFTVANTLTLGDRASVEKNINYSGTGKLVRSANAVVVGDIIENTKIADPKSHNWLPLLATLFATLFVYLLFKNELKNLASEINKKPGQASLAGLAALLLLPVVSIFLIVTILGSILGVLSLLLFLSLVVLVYVVTPVMVGSVIAKIMKSKDQVNLIWILVGTCVIQLLPFLPVVGPFIIFIFLVLTTGAMALRVYSQFSRS